MKSCTAYTFLLAVVCVNTRMRGWVLFRERHIHERRTAKKYVSDVR